MADAQHLKAGRRLGKRLVGRGPSNQALGRFAQHTNNLGNSKKDTWTPHAYNTNCEYVV
jgi:hypothetical protein